MIETEYNLEDQQKCWFAPICRHRVLNDGFCDNNNFCEIHHKMTFLCDNALLTPKDRYPIRLIPDADGTDKDKFIQLKEIQTNIASFVVEGKNLFIYSKITGNGKSGWSKKLLLQWLGSIVTTTDYTCRGLFINVPRFFTELKTNISAKSEYIEHIKNAILQADLVVWDEIAVKNITDFEHDNLLNYINLRIDMGKSNIFTSNMTPDELREKLGDRLYSRIIQTSTLIEFNGKDKRGLNI